MHPPGLDFQQAPPISVPFRFFLTAPVFALLAAAVALWSGADIFSSRWMPSTLAAVHLLTLGSMTMVMVGAMIQILPVLAGTPVARPLLVAWIVHPSLVLGTLLFAGSFLSAQAVFLQMAVFVLGAGLAVFFIALMTTLPRVRNLTPTVIAIGLATLALGVTVVLGVTLGVSRAWGTVLPSMSWRDLHPTWGIIGWTGLLIAGVAYQTVPMFQVTPNYPGWLMRAFGGVVFVALTLLSLAQWHGDDTPWRWLALFCMALLVGAIILFAGITLKLQRERRRRLPDVTLEYWRVGMVCVVFAALLWMSQQFSPLVFGQAEVLLGVLMIIGAAMSFVNGMLCKVAPFLSWFHLQAGNASGAKLPNVKSMLPEKAQRLQLRLHLAALVLCIGAALLPSVFTYPAAILFGAASVSVLWNVATVGRLYRRLAAPVLQPT